MNSIRQIQALNKRELEAGVSPEASWHADYKDTAHIYIGGLPFEFSEGDIITIFSQFGEPVFINLVRDKETGKSKGFAFLKYEDQRSTDLAVDNLGGATVMGRVLRVDHTRYKKKDDEDLGDNTMGYGAESADGSESRKKRRIEDTKSEEGVERRPLLKEERELAELMSSHDDDDPMKSYLIQQKKEEVEAALSKVKAKVKVKESRSWRHRRDDRDDRDDERSRRYRQPRNDSEDSIRDGYERSRRHGRGSPSPSRSPSRERRRRRRSASQENRKYQSLSPERRRHRRSTSRERRDERPKSRERRRR